MSARKRKGDAKSPRKGKGADARDQARSKQQASVIRQEYTANPVMLVTVSNFTPPPSRKKKGALNDRAADKAKERERKRRSGPTADGAPTRTDGTRKSGGGGGGGARAGKQPITLPSSKQSIGTTPKSTKQRSSDGASTPGTRRRANADGAGPAKKGGSTGNGNVKMKAASGGGKGTKGKKSGKKAKKKVDIRVFLNGHPKVASIHVDVASCINRDDSLKAVFAMIGQAFEQYPKRFKASRLLARDLETVIANGHELQDGGHYLMCGNEAPYASKLPNDFKPTAHLSNADWAVLEKQYSTVDKKTIRFLKKTFDLHDIDRSESLDIEEIARALSFVHGRGTYNQGEILSFIKPLIDEFDHNKDGEMCFEEFMDFWSKSQSPAAEGDSKALLEYRQKAKDAEQHEDVDDGKSKACIVM